MEKFYINKCALEQQMAVLLDQMVRVHLVPPSYQDNTCDFLRNIAVFFRMYEACIGRVPTFYMTYSDMQEAAHQFPSEEVFNYLPDQFQICLDDVAYLHHYPNRLEAYREYVNAVLARKEYPYFKHEKDCPSSEILAAIAFKRKDLLDRPEFIQNVPFLVESSLRQKLSEISCMPCAMLSRDSSKQWMRWEDFVSACYDVVDLYAKRHFLWRWCLYGFSPVSSIDDLAYSRFPWLSVIEEGYMLHLLFWIENRVLNFDFDIFERLGLISDGSGRW